MAPYAFIVDCATLPKGPNTLIAYAYDLAGNESAPSRVEVVVEEAPNLAPVADAGPDRSVAENSLVILDAGNSADPDGTVAAYHWVQTSGPGVTLSDPAASVVLFDAPKAGPSGAALTFELTVTDDGGLSDTDTVTFQILGEGAAEGDASCEAYSWLGNLEDADHALTRRTTALPSGKYSRRLTQA